MEKKYVSEALMVSHQSAEGLFRLGIIDADEMREFDNLCLVKKPKTTNEIESSPEVAHIRA